MTTRARVILELAAITFIAFLACLLSLGLLHPVLGTIVVAAVLVGGGGYIAWRERAAPDSRSTFSVLILFETLVASALIVGVTEASNMGPKFALVAMLFWPFTATFGAFLELLTGGAFPWALLCLLLGSLISGLVRWL